MNKKPIRFFDMFCGAGGSSHGAVMAGANPVAALDLWKLAAETYKLNFPDATVFQMSANSLSPTSVMEAVGKIDLLLASPECTSHSIARGNKPRCEKSRETAFEVVRFAKVLRPRWIIVENVIQMQKWHRFDKWHQAIKDIGYKTRMAVLDAQYFGTPQSRRRLFIVGDLYGPPSMPRPGQRTKKTVASHVLGHGESRNKRWGFSPVLSPKRAKATIERFQRAIDELGAGTPFIMVYYGTDGAGGFQTLDRPLRTVTTVDRFAFVRPNGTSHEMRMLQPSELAAAMGFPEHHIWPQCTRREQIKLIGNAVCPPVMQAIVSALTDRTSKEDVT